MKEEIIQAKKDWAELNELVKKHCLTKPEELYGILHGHNSQPEDNMFDVNFKSICATVYTISKDRPHNQLSMWDVEVWDKQECFLDTINIDEQ